MAIVVSCNCGKSFSAHEKYAGKKGKCPSCGTVLRVPALPPPPPPPAEEQFPDDAYVLRDLEAAVPPPPPPMEYNDPVPARMPTTVIVEKEEEESGSGFRVREYLYFALLLAFIPLALFTFIATDTDLEERLERTLAKNKETVEKLEASGGSEETLFKLLPEHRIEGALLPRDTSAHWGFAALSGLAFFGLMRFCFPGTCANSKNLTLTALFTATLGIAFLLAIQWIADFTQGYIVTGRGIAVLIFYILKFIGFSYNAALDPDNGFLLSFLGFTFGVGLCEEVCKAIPILWWQQKYGLPSWRFAALIGLASGVGFGVSEGITYSSDFYNGVTGGEIYLVRFASCVALHAVWSASVAVAIFNLQYKVDTSEPWLVAIRAALLPMVLHGLYDTLLKKEMNVYALITALASFVFLAWQIETARRRFGEEEESQEEEELASTRVRRAGTMMRV